MLLDRKSRQKFGLLTASVKIRGAVGKMARDSFSCQIYKIQPLMTGRRSADWESRHGRKKSSAIKQGFSTHRAVQ